MDREFLWQPPVPHPTGHRSYIWDEDNTKWIINNAQPYPTWVWNEESEEWEAPKAKPVDGKKYYWNEEDGEWVLGENQDEGRSGK